MRSRWAEEVTDKLSYWGKLPHIALGMWPRDAQSSCVAQQAIAQFQSDGSATRMHRVTYKLLQKDNGLPFAEMISDLAETGTMAPACFKYSIVDNFQSHAHAAAYLAAWADCQHMPQQFTKEAHKTFVPDNWERLLTCVAESS
jgi:hypothetical protein